MTAPCKGESAMVSSKRATGKREQYTESLAYHDSNDQNLLVGEGSAVARVDRKVVLRRALVRD